MGFRFLERLDYSSYYSYMEKATISEIKNRLSAYLRKVRAGETVLILDRNHPVARLEQVDRQSQPESRTALLERDGLLETFYSTHSDGDASFPCASAQA